MDSEIHVFMAHRFGHFLAVVCERSRHSALVWVRGSIFWVVAYGLLASVPVVGFNV